MTEEEELVRLIEKLGDDLKTLIDLVESIYNTVQNKYGINLNTLAIVKMKWNIRDIETYYTTFHADIFEEINKKKEGHHVS